MKNILVVGSSNTDMVIRVPHIPGPGETILGGEFTMTPGGVAKAVITLGERGAYASSVEFEGLVPAFRVDPVDTTAAGDIFNGAFAVALAEKSSLKDALHDRSLSPRPNARALLNSDKGKPGTVPARGTLLIRI